MGRETNIRAQATLMHEQTHAHFLEAISCTIREQTHTKKTFWVGRRHHPLRQCKRTAPEEVYKPESRKVRRHLRLAV